MHTLDRLLNGIVFVLFVLMLVLVTIQVVNRYGMGYSLPWTEELTRTAYTLLIFVGSTLAVLRCNHVRVNSVLNLFPEGLKRALAVFSGIASAVFFAFVAYGNFIYTMVNLDARFTTVQWLTIGQVMAVVCISSVLSALLFIYRVVNPCEDDAETEEPTL